MSEKTGLEDKYRSIDCPQCGSNFFRRPEREATGGEEKFSLKCAKCGSHWFFWISSNCVNCKAKITDKTWEYCPKCGTKVEK